MFREAFIRGDSGSLRGVASSLLHLFSSLGQPRRVLSQGQLARAVEGTLKLMAPGHGPPAKVKLSIMI